MSFVHAKSAFVSLNAVNLSTFVNSTDLKQEADEHDTTTYGKNSHTYAGGLKDGTVTLKGIYDNVTAGPKATIQPLLGTVVAFIYRGEGTGTGKRQDAGNVLVKSYEESAPVADMIMWSAELQLSDDLATTTQP